VTNVRIVLADPRTGRPPEGSAVNGRQLIVLADTVLSEDGAHRAIPLWLPGRSAKVLWALLDRPARDTAMADFLEVTAVRLLDAAGVAVTAVDIEPASEAVAGRSPGTATARAWLAAAAGVRQVLVSAEYGLKLAVVAEAPVRVADEVMDRLAVPVDGEDVLAPFLFPAARSQQRRRFEPRNMVFADGLDRWELAGSFLAAGPPHWQDYSCTAGDRSAVLAAAVPDPSGFAVLIQEIYAEDYLGRTVTFRGQLRGAGRAGLQLAAGRAVDSPGARPPEPVPVSSDWTWHEVTVPVPGDAAVIRFGIWLAGRGRIELRGAELSPAPPRTQK
jgi:hypothetical protein